LRCALAQGTAPKNIDLMITPGFLQRVLSMLALVLFMTNAAIAQLRITNSTSYKLYVGLAFYYDGSWKTKGWYALEPGETMKPFDFWDVNYDASLATDFYYCVADENDEWWKSDNAGYFAVDAEDEFFINNANQKSALNKNSNYIWKKFHYVDGSLALLEFSKDVYIKEIQGCPSGDCENGIGTYCWVYNGKRYEGNWVNGKRHGQGKCTYHVNNSSFPGCVYEGTWKDDSFYKGVLKYPDGKRYEGYFKSSKYHGKGVLYDSNGRVMQSGTWDSGVLLESDQSTASTPNASSGSSTMRPKVWALVVGVSKYSAAQGINDLNFCDDDAQAVYDFMRSPEGGSVPSGQIRLLKDYNATRTNILNAANDLFIQATTNDLLLFYFSGHGGPNMFVAHDQYIKHEDLRNIVNRSKAGKKICVADACFSGTWDKKSTLQSKAMSDLEVEALYYATLASSGNGLALLMSSQPNETSLEDQPLQMGMFTYYYIRGLRGAADDNFDNVISIQEIYDYVKKSVRDRAWSTYEHKQNPQLKGTFDHDMPVGVIRN